MKQQTIFDSDLKADTHTQYWKIFCDGAARNNPGPAGAGVRITCDDKIIKETGTYLGSKTNNQAEYLALLLGLYYVKKLAQEPMMLLIVSDSQLLVRQLQGLYKVKHPDLKPLYTLAVAMLAGMRYDVAHVLREENTRADALANRGIDEKIPAPDEFLTLLRNHGISI